MFCVFRHCERSVAISISNTVVYMRLPRSARNDTKKICVAVVKYSDYLLMADSYLLDNVVYSAGRLQVIPAFTPCSCCIETIKHIDHRVFVYT